MWTEDPSNYFSMIKEDNKKLILLNYDRTSDIFLIDLDNRLDFARDV